MADNFDFTPGSGKTGAADDIGGVLYPRVKLTQGADGSATDVSSDAPLQVTLANTGANATAIKVDGSDVTQPVSAASLPLPTGAATSAKQPALGTAGSAATDVITVQGIASMTALKVDGSAVTQPVSAASLPLPSGAATSAKQPALGTAGSASADVITVQGVASMTALKVDGSAVTQPVSISGNQAVNVAQMNGVATTMGNGASGTGVQRVTIASDSTGQVKLAAGTSLIGQIAASHETSTIYNGTTALTPKFAAIAASTSGNNTVVAAVASKKIRVIAAQLVANGAVNAKWQSGAGGTDLTGLAYCAANGGYILPFNPAGWFETGSNTLLNLNLSAAVAVGGSITYIEV